MIKREIIEIEIMEERTIFIKETISKEDMIRKKRILENVMTIIKGMSFIKEKMDTEKMD